MRGRPKSFHDRTEQATVQSVERALLLLQVIAETPGLTLSELATRADQAPATVHRMLVTLSGQGFVESDDQHWHIGPGAWRTGSAFLRRTKLTERAAGPMQALMQGTGETANLGVESGGEVLFLTQVETHEAIRAFFPPGTKSPMHVSGIGKALLAWFAPGRRAPIVARGLPGFTARSLTEPAALEVDLAATRARGFAVDDQEKAEGMRCIAAPIFNALGDPVAGISISGPAFRLPLSEAARIGATVRAAADQVTLAIGGQAPV
jgi:IclR family acetate operon transcriptional repressor